MAIQIPNPGTGNGATGDNEFVLWTKVKDNFSNTSHAASRLVGENAGNVMQVGAFGLGGYVPKIENTSFAELDLPSGLYTSNEITDSPTSYNEGFNYVLQRSNINHFTLMAISAQIPTRGTRMFLRQFSNGVPTDWVKVYTDNNTTLDGNGALKPSSPVLRVFSDCITGNHDGDAMAATYTKNGVGDYTITGTTGLRTDGWYVVIPNDMNGNPKVAITLDDTDGVITLKTYVRIFDMSTFKFVPDLEQPLDIPEGRWVDLRFNDLPVEIEDDTQAED